MRSVLHSLLAASCTHVVVVEEGKVALLYLVELTLSETAAMVRHARTTQSGGILLYVLAEVCGRRLYRFTAVRESGQEQGVLQALPGQVQAEAGGEDGLLCPQTSRDSRQEQIQHAKEQAHRSLHQHRHYCTG